MQSKRAAPRHLVLREQLPDLAGGDVAAAAVALGGAAVQRAALAARRGAHRAAHAEALLLGLLADVLHDGVRADPVVAAALAPLPDARALLLLHPQPHPSLLNTAAELWVPRDATPAP